MLQAHATSRILDSLLRNARSRVRFRQPTCHRFACHPSLPSAANIPQSNRGRTPRVSATSLTIQLLYPRLVRSMRRVGSAAFAFEWWSFLSVFMRMQLAYQISMTHSQDDGAQFLGVNCGRDCSSQASVPRSNDDFPTSVSNRRKFDVHWPQYDRLKSRFLEAERG